MAKTDYELEALLDLDGHRYEFGSGYQVKLEAQRVEATTGMSMARERSSPTTTEVQSNCWKISTKR